MKIRLEISPLATPYISGVGHYTRLLGEALSRQEGVDFEATYFNFLNRQIQPAVTYPTKVRKNPHFPLRVYAKLQSFGIAPPFDAFLSEVDLTIFTNFATWPVAKSKKRATVIHDLTYLHFPEAVEAKNLKHLKRVIPRSIKEADFIITVSHTIKDELVATFNLDPDHCIVTPIPPDQSFFQQYPAERLSEVKTKYNLDPNKQYLYFIGNREPRKNLATLVKAYRLLPESIRQTYSLVIAGGQGWNSEESTRTIDEAVANGADIKVIGYIEQEDNPVLYQGAALFILPSLYEGFGMPILEAFASGCPVVASDIPVLREVGGSHALYADPASPDAFAAVIQNALSQPAAPREILQAVVRQFSWVQNAETIVEKASSLL